MPGKTDGARASRGVADEGSFASMTSSLSIVSNFGMDQQKIPEDGVVTVQGLIVAGCASCSAKDLRSLAEPSRVPMLKKFAR